MDSSFSDHICETDDPYADQFYAIAERIYDSVRGLGVADFAIGADRSLFAEEHIYRNGTTACLSDAELFAIVEHHGNDSPDGAAKCEHVETGVTNLDTYLFRVFGPDGTLLVWSMVGFLASEVEHRDARRLCDHVQGIVTHFIQLWFSNLQIELELVAEKKRSKRLERVGQQDHLTRLNNAAAFKSRADDILGKTSQMATLILLDVDNFKAVNDVFGHPFGDRYLKQIARAMAASLPKGSIIGRMGGDEFAAFVPLPMALQRIQFTSSRGLDEWMKSFTTDVMRRCAYQVRKAIKQLSKADLGDVSMGAAIYPLQSDNLERLIELADAAVYANKGGPQNKQPLVFDADNHYAFSNRLLKRRFKRAIETGQIVPFLQPIVNLQSGEISGFEALARWHDDRLGYLVPADFRQVFKDPDMAQEVTRAVAQQAFKQLAQIRSFSQTGTERVSINLSTCELIDPQFVFAMDDMLQEAGLPWAALDIEVTEKVMMGPINGPVFRTVSEMRSRGARIALDDFGTGYGGLQHLKDWPIDILKIDRSFLTNIEETHGNRVIVKAIVEIASQLDLSVVAEGVETDAVHKFVTDLGCTAGQGYLYSRPQRADLIARAMLNAKNWNDLKADLEKSQSDDETNTVHDFPVKSIDSDWTIALTETGFCSTNAAPRAQAASKA